MFLMSNETRDQLGISPHEAGAEMNFLMPRRIAEVTKSTRRRGVGLKSACLWSLGLLALRAVGSDKATKGGEEGLVNVGLETEEDLDGHGLAKSCLPELVVAEEVEAL